jgi:hypothetical protein
MAIAFIRAKIISRGKGQSAIACAAYRSGQKLEDRQEEKTQDYERRNGVLTEGIVTPANAPEWMRDREELWNAVERREDRSTRPDQAQLAREFVIALPHELTNEQREFLVKNILKEAAARRGMVADYAIHTPDLEGDNRNYHAHVMLTMREIDPADWDGFGKKSRTWNTRPELEKFKAIAERETNRMLERSGHEARINFELKDDHEPQIHLGHEASAMERRGIETDKGNENRERAARNAARLEITGALKILAQEMAAIEQEPEARELSPAEKLSAIKREYWQEQRREVAGYIKESWEKSERDPLQFVVSIGERNLSLARNDKGQLVAIDESGAAHYLASDLNKQISAAFPKDLNVPTVEELKARELAQKEEQKAERDKERAEREKPLETGTLDIAKAEWMEQRDIRENIREAWDRSGAGEITFAESLAGYGYKLAHENMWGYVVIDDKAAEHRLTNSDTLNLNYDAVKWRLDHDKAGLPTIEQAKQAQIDAMPAREQTAAAIEQQRADARDYADIITTRREAEREALKAPSDDATRQTRGQAAQEFKTLEQGAAKGLEQATDQLGGIVESLTGGSNREQDYKRYLSDPEYRKAYHARQAEERAAAQARAKALNHIMDSWERGKAISRDDIAGLSSIEQENIKTKGDDYIRQLVEDHRRRQEREREERERQRTRER